MKKAVGKKKRRPAATGKITGRDVVVSTILVPTDFSPHSAKALDYACVLGAACGAVLHLLHVNDVGVESPTLARFFRTKSKINAQLRRRLESIAAKLVLPTRGLRCHLRAGKAFDEICQAARELEADLIIAATHGYGGLQRVLLGSTTERIVQHSPCPVLVVREHEREFISGGKRKAAPNRRQVRLDRILVPTDFSAHSRFALTYALALAQHFGAELILLHVVSPHYYATNPEYLSSDYGLLLDEMREMAKDDMNTLVRAIEGEGIPFQARIETGHSVQKILDVTSECSADLIITSTHGRTGLEHVLIGSVAEQVVRYAKCPVLVVPRVKTKRGGRKGTSR